jgi:hypothetical protein
MSESDVPDVSDGRRSGDFTSRYPCNAWVQITLEFVYLCAVLGIAGALLFWVGYDLALCARQPDRNVLSALECGVHRELVIWLAISLAGICGGASFALKWHYHAVARWLWNRDRVIWRLTVPILSGVLAVFVAFMIAGGIVPFFNKHAFDNFYIALGFGFFAGYFSDHVLAALQRLAKHTFGLLDQPDGGKPKPHTDGRQQ